VERIVRGGCGRVLGRRTARARFAWGFGVGDGFMGAASASAVGARFPPPFGCLVMICGRHRRHTTMTSIELDNRTAFEALTTRHRRELQLHCYRMLGSLEESEDLVQETFLRAWRRRETYQGRSTPRAWLYRIATNACLDVLHKSPRRPRGGEVPWLQPCPDELLAEPEAEPEALVVAKETVELAFLVAIQHLPPKTRAVLILRDVLDWPAKDTAELLETSVAAVNSALQRARAGLKEHLPERRAEWAPGADPTEAERGLLDRYVEASERGDAHAIAALMREDATWSMPPEPGLWHGRDKIVGSWIEGGMGTPEFGEFRCLVTSANRQPAVACYLRSPGEDVYEALALDVLRIEEGEIADITSFTGVFAAFGLPPKL
jgi:RNA polymerase sigma-70 factor (ECF subfamily)